MTEEEGSFYNPFFVIKNIQLNLFTDAIFSLIKLACTGNVNIPHGRFLVSTSSPTL